MGIYGLNFNLFIRICRIFFHGDSVSIFSLPDAQFFNQIPGCCLLFSDVRKNEERSLRTDCVMSTGKPVLPCELRFGSVILS